MKKLNAQQLRRSDPDKTELINIKRKPIYLVLDRIIDTYNIGSFFRLADAIAAEIMILCGDMQYPPNSRIHKAAVGTENWVPWERKETTLQAIKELKDQGIFTIAIEQAKNSVSYKDLRIRDQNVSNRSSHIKNGEFFLPVAIIAGNESYGMEKEVLKEVDLVVEIPMYGVNISFNTWGTTAVVAYKILEFV